MLQQIKQFFKKSNEMVDAVDYLTNHMNYHLANICDKEFTMFGKQQLHFLVNSKTNNLNNKQIDKVINLALHNVVSNNKAKYMITKNAIYLSAH